MQHSHGHQRCQRKNWQLNKHDQQKKPVVKKKKKKATKVKVKQTEILYNQLHLPDNRN